MSLRAKQILTAFPDFPEQNIIMGFQKSLVHFDVTLDDGPHNILKSCAKYPVLMRRPWNESLSGILSRKPLWRVFTADRSDQRIDAVR